MHALFGLHFLVNVNRLCDFTRSNSSQLVLYSDDLMLYELFNQKRTVSNFKVTLLKSSNGLMNILKSSKCKHMLLTLKATTTPPFLLHDRSDLFEEVNIHITADLRWDMHMHISICTRRGQLLGLLCGCFLRYC